MRYIDVKNFNQVALVAGERIAVGEPTTPSPTYCIMTGVIELKVDVRRCSHNKTYEMS